MPAVSSLFEQCAREVCAEDLPSADTPGPASRAPPPPQQPSQHSMVYGVGNVDGDGNCFFYALLHAASQNKSSLEMLLRCFALERVVSSTGNIDQMFFAQQMRKRLVEMLKQECDDIDDLWQEVQTSRDTGKDDTNLLRMYLRAYHHMRGSFMDDVLSGMKPPAHERDRDMRFFRSAVMMAIFADNRRQLNNIGSDNERNEWMKAIKDARSAVMYTMSQKVASALIVSHPYLFVSSVMKALEEKDTFVSGIDVDFVRARLNECSKGSVKLIVSSPTEQTLEEYVAKRQRVPPALNPAHLYLMNRADHYYYITMHPSTRGAQNGGVGGSSNTRRRRRCRIRARTRKQTSCRRRFPRRSSHMRRRSSRRQRTRHRRHIYS